MARPGAGITLPGHRKNPNARWSRLQELVLLPLTQDAGYPPFFAFIQEAVGQLEWPPRSVPPLVRLPENLGKKLRIPIDGCCSYPGRT